MKVLPVNQINKVSDYPYGRLRAEVSFSLEFQSKKGFRSVFQSINPKNNRVNKPKKSTYTDFAFQYIEDETGHVKTNYYHVYTKESIINICNVINDNFVALELKKEHIQHIYGCILSNLTISLAYAKNEEEKKILKDTAEIAKKSFLTGEINFLDIVNTLK